MEYKGKLFGKVGNKYIPLTMTSEEVNNLKAIVDAIGFEPTANGSVFKPRCGYKKFHELLAKQTNDIESEYIKGWSAILKDFIEYLQDRNFFDDDIWVENDVIKDFLNEKETRREA